MPCDKTIILFVILKRIKNKISSYFTIKEMSKKVKYDILIINKDTYLKDLIKVYPNLKKDMIKISERFKILQGPLAAVMLPKATLEKVSEKGDIDLNILIEKIKELIKTY